MFNEHITMFTDYLKNATFAAFTARARGEYDWINIKIFPNTKIANQESDSYRSTFGEIIDKYEAFDLTVVKAPSFIETINYSLDEFNEFIQKWRNKVSSISE